MHVLGVVYLDAVYEHSCVFAAKAPDIDSLQASDSTVVPELDPGKAPDSLGDSRNRLQLMGFDPLGDDQAAGGGAYAGGFQGVRSFASLRMTLWGRLVLPNHRDRGEQQEAE